MPCKYTRLIFFDIYRTVWMLDLFISRSKLILYIRRDLYYTRLLQSRWISDTSVEIWMCLRRDRWSVSLSLCLSHTLFFWMAVWWKGFPTRPGLMTFSSGQCIERLCDPRWLTTLHHFLLPFLANINHVNNRPCALYQSPLSHVDFISNLEWWIINEGEKPVSPFYSVKTVND